MFQTFIRVQNELGDQFDIPKGAPLRKGVKPVPGYPEHRGHAGRPPKPRLRKDGSRAISSYADLTKPDLENEIARRNENRDDSDRIEVEGRGNKPDLIAALEADDKRAITTTGGTPDTGATTNTDTGQAGEKE